MLRNIASNDCSNMANKLTKRKYYMTSNENNSKDCGRASEKTREEINRRDETNIT